MRLDMSFTRVLTLIDLKVDECIANFDFDLKIKAMILFCKYCLGLSLILLCKLLLVLFRFGNKLPSALIQDFDFFLLSSFLV